MPIEYFDETTILRYNVGYINNISIRGYFMKIINKLLLICSAFVLTNENMNTMGAQFIRIKDITHAGRTQQERNAQLEAVRIAVDHLGNSAWKRVSQYANCGLNAKECKIVWERCINPRRPMSVVELHSFAYYYNQYKNDIKQMRVHFYNRPEGFVERIHEYARSAMYDKIQVLQNAIREEEQKIMNDPSYELDGRLNIEMIELQINSLSAMDLDSYTLYRLITNK